MKLLIEGFLQNLFYVIPNLGGISIAFLDSSKFNGIPQVHMLQPFNHKDLAKRSLVDRINDLRQCVILYPNKPKESVFGKYVKAPVIGKCSIVCFILIGITFNVFNYLCPEQKLDGEYIESQLIVVVTENKSFIEPQQAVLQMQELTPEEKSLDRYFPVYYKLYIIELYMHKVKILLGIAKRYFS